MREYAEDPGGSLRVEFVSDADPDALARTHPSVAVIERPEVIVEAGPRTVMWVLNTHAKNGILRKTPLPPRNDIVRVYGENTTKRGFPLSCHPYSDTRIRVIAGRSVRVRDLLSGIHSPGRTGIVGPCTGYSRAGIVRPSMRLDGSERSKYPSRYASSVSEAASNP